MADSGGKERRRRPRVPVGHDVVVRIHTANAAPVIDLSENGALVEVASVLRPGTSYALRLTLSQGLHLNITTRVVRTFVHSFTPQAGSETTVTYHAAVEFVGISEQDRELLRAHLESLSGNMDVEFE
jgi:hypothetical protein